MPTSNLQPFCAKHKYTFSQWWNKMSTNKITPTPILQTTLNNLSLCLFCHMLYAVFYKAPFGTNVAYTMYMKLGPVLERLFSFPGFRSRVGRWRRDAQVLVARDDHGPPEGRQRQLARPQLRQRRHTHRGNLQTNHCDGKRTRTYRDECLGQHLKQTGMKRLNLLLGHYIKKG